MGDACDFHVYLPFAMFRCYRYDFSCVKDGVPAFFALRKVFQGATNLSQVGFLLGYGYDWESCCGVECLDVYYVEAGECYSVEHYYA